MKHLTLVWAVFAVLSWSLVSCGQAGAAQVGFALAAADDIVGDPQQDGQPGGEQQGGEEAATEDTGDQGDQADQGDQPVSEENKEQ
jgi:hypothetical protein